VVIIILIIIGYREGDRKVKLAEENECLQEQIDSLKSEISDLEDYIRELEGYR
jgi:prefoldin subunit 5